MVKINRKDKSIFYITYKCQICGKEFIDYKKQHRKYCNRKCYGIYQRGKPGNRLNKPCSEKTKKLLRENHKGQHYSPKTEFKKGRKQFHTKTQGFQKGHKINLGRKPTKKARKNMSKAKKGDKSFLYIDGRSKNRERCIHTSSTMEYKLWREAVFKRDNWTCQNKDCNKNKCYLEAHHIKSWAKYPELRYELSNGITLCKECHNLIRKKYFKINSRHNRKLSS
jgi:hypothetical protein